MTKIVKNWIKSSEYDLSTAKSLLKSRHKVYVIFMCHLAVEKILKAVFLGKFKKLAPYTHNLVYLINLLELGLPTRLMEFVEELNDKSVVTRYPENIQEMERKLSLKTAKEHIVKTKEVIQWLRRNTNCLR